MDGQREWMEKDYYKVLGVKKTDSAKEITKAYRNLARKYHPDANPGDTAAEEKFKEISSAYDVVGDEDTRKKYDEFRSLGGGFPGGGYPGGGFPGGGAGGFPGGARDVGDLGDLSDLLGGLFGGSRGGSSRGGFGGFGPMPGTDLKAGLTLSFDEAVNGVTKSVRINSEALERPMEVNVRIPPGVSNGQRIRVGGKGARSREGGEPGDLLVTITIQPHELFDRDGLDILVDVPITFAEASLGAKVKLPTLNGSSVTVKIPAGTQSGRVFRVRGRGVQGSSGTGDLLATVNVHVPESLGDEERALIEELAKVSEPAPRG